MLKFHTPCERYTHSPSNYDDDNGFLSAVTSGIQQNPLAVTIQLNSVPVEFHIDIGAEDTVITEALYYKLGFPAPDQTLKGSNNKFLVWKACL